MSKRPKAITADDPLNARLPMVGEHRPKGYISPLASEVRLTRAPQQTMRHDEEHVLLVNHSQLARLFLDLASNPARATCV